MAFKIRKGLAGIKSKMIFNQKQKVKICYVVSIDITLRFLLFDQLKFLQSQGYNVSAVCSPGKWIEDIEKEGIKVKTIRFKRKIFSPISDLIALVNLFFYFKKEKFDIVHTHTPKAALLGQIAARVAGIPISINTIHGLYFQENTPWFKRKFFISIEKIISTLSCSIFSVNKGDIKTAIREGICSAEKIKYIGGWVDLERFNPYRFSEDFIQRKKTEIGIPRNTAVIGIVARLVIEKGYLDLFEAYKKVLEKFPETMLLVVGPKEPEKKDAFSPTIIKNYSIENNVIFLGERTDVDEIYALVDVSILPSHREGLGISLLEAQAMGKPVVATDIRGCREAVDDGKTGILVPIKNSEKLAEAIIYLFKNPEKAKKMGEEGRKKIVKEFDERLVFDRIRKEYERLIKDKLK